MLPGTMLCACYGMINKKGNISIFIDFSVRKRQAMKC